ncbi:unnamed protein product [Durusdinium trenchii]|uniref:Uncharacterized protein n=1 Tax=Durusdinium trenchii TaxID=1381693 RepID=A0ABP0IMV3_9DINO
MPEHDVDSDTGNGQLVRLSTGQRARFSANDRRERGQQKRDGSPIEAGAGRANAGEKTIAVEVALVVIAVVALIDERRTTGEALQGVALVALGSRESGVAVGLVDFADGISNVVQFLNDSVLDFAQADDHADDEDGRNENEFSRDDEAGFVIEESTQHL